MRNYLAGAVCMITFFGCASAHERKIRRAFNAAKEDNYTAFAAEIGLNEERNKSLFENLRGVSRTKNDIKVTTPDLTELPQNPEVPFCARAYFYKYSFWDFRIISFDDGTVYYFVFRRDANGNPSIAEVIWGGQSGLGPALAGLFTHSSGRRTSSPSPFENCSGMNREATRVSR